MYLPVAFLTLHALLPAHPPMSDDREVRALISAFERAGWQTTRSDVEGGTAVMVTNDAKPFYLFVFNTIDGKLQRSPMRDPNFQMEHSLASDPDAKLFDYGLWPSIKDFAVKFSSDSKNINRLAAKEATFQYPLISQIPRRSTAGPMNIEDAKKIVNVLRQGKYIGYITYGADANADVEHEIPNDVRISAAKSNGDFVFLRLYHAEERWVGYYPTVVQLRGSSLNLMASTLDDLALLPFQPGFDRIIPLFKVAGAEGYWNATDEDRGQAGLWMRDVLGSKLPGGPLPPAKASELIQKLDDVSRDKKGLVMWSSGSRSVAQFYNSEESLTYVELEDNEIVASFGLQEAQERCEGTRDKSLWECYVGVSAQFGHHDLMCSLYRNKKMRG